MAALNVNVDYLATLAPPKGDVRLANFFESIEDVRTVFAQLMANVRTVQDYDRYKTNQLVPQETNLALGDVAADVADELRRQAVGAERSFMFARPPAETERKVQGDRELLRRVISNLGLCELRRAPARTEVAMSVTETDAATRFRVTVPGESLQGADRLNALAPCAQRSVMAVGYGLGPALARAIVELHDGHLWIEDVPEGGCAFVFELKWQRRGPEPKRRPDRLERV